MESDLVGDIEKKGMLERVGNTFAGVSEEGRGNQHKRRRTGESTAKNSGRKEGGSDNKSKKTGNNFLMGGRKNGGRKV